MFGLFSYATLTILNYCGNFKMVTGRDSVHFGTQFLQDIYYASTPIASSLARVGSRSSANL